MNLDQRLLINLAKDTLPLEVRSILPLRAHGSARKIYRLVMGDGSSNVGIVNESSDENAAFIGFSKSFKTLGLEVPNILSSDNKTAYIETDLGDTTLMNIVVSAREKKSLNIEIHNYYQQAIDQLIIFQTKGLSVIDTTLCYQGTKFDEKAVANDIHYFCNEYLSRVSLWDSNDDFTDDIAELTHVCKDFDPGYFMYRDFQSRNIMIQNQTLYFIDYQSGREGPLQYDLASLLFQSQANLNPDMRESLLEYYLSQLDKHVKIDHNKFKERYIVFVLVRALQNLGAYGKLGLGQQKEYFKASIPFALKNCKYILDHWPKNLASVNLKNKIKRII